MSVLDVTNPKPRPEEYLSGLVYALSEIDWRIGWGKSMGYGPAYAGGLNDVKIRLEASISRCRRGEGPESMSSITCTATDPTQWLADDFNRQLDEAGITNSIDIVGKCPKPLMPQERLAIALAELGQRRRMYSTHPITQKENT